jgi:hypothetical protein
MSAKIDQVTGDVMIKRKGKTQRHQATKGTVINDGDLLIIGKNSFVEYTCDNGIKTTQTKNWRYGLNDLCPINSPSLTKTAEKLSLKLATTRWELAEVKIAQGKSGEAKNLLEKAISEFSEL